MSRSRLVLLFGLALCASTCGGEGAETPLNLGVEGASCLRTPDCAPPLQCIGNVCTSLGVDIGVDVALGRRADAPGEISFPAPDVAPDRIAAPDTPAAPPDVPRRPDIYQPFDVPPDWVPHGPDIPLVAPDTFTGCGGLGVESDWAGEFDGSILFWNVEAPPGLEGQVPESGTLIVSGSLGFEIACLEQKLVVMGTLSGYGRAEGEVGDHPFEATLRGEYNPLDETMTTVIDGSVRLFFLFEIYFEGQLSGRLVRDDRFDGDWSGRATGNNLDLEGEASGGGDWWAAVE